MKGQMFAVGIVMACGLAMMIMARSLIFSLESTRDGYYERNRFADVFSSLKRAPNSLRTRLAEIPGVAAAETRVVGSLTLDLPGLAEPADGTILSLPEDRPIRRLCESRQIEREISHHARLRRRDTGDFREPRAQ